MPKPAMLWWCLTAMVVGGLEASLAQGPFHRPLELPLPAGRWVHDVADFDGDGDLDVLTTDQAFLNDGTGTFQPGPLLPVTVGASYGDLDGDGDVDLVTDTGEVRLAAPGGYVLAATLPLPVATSGWIRATLGDVDQDGDLDLLLLALPSMGGGYIAPVGIISGAPTLWLNDGSGTFTDATTNLGAPPAGLGAPEFLDLDGDGDLDVLSEWFGLLFNDGSGVFTQQPISGLVGRLTPGDFDGDGLTDLVWRTLGGTVVARGTPGGFATPTPAAPVSGSALGALDVDGDGTDELVMDRGQSLTIHDVNVVTGVSLTPLQTLHGELRPSGGVRRPALLDADGDGDRDLVLTLEGVSRTLLADGSGQLQELFADRPSDAIAVGVGDFNGDGTTDLAGLRWQSNGANLSLLWNDGRGRFALQPSTLNLGYNGLDQVESADLDADFDDDLVVIGVEYVGGAPMVAMKTLLSAGGGFSVQATRLFPTRPRVRTGDFNGDGAVDVVTFGATSTLTVTSGFTEVWISNGGGGFRPPVGLYAPASIDVLVGDLDGDGDQDLVELALGLGSWFHFNDGLGGFTTVPVAGITGAGGALVDSDGDGDLDLLTTGVGAPFLVASFMNDGTGTFSPPPVVAAATIPLPSAMGPMVVGDVDEDGNPDVVGSFGVWLPGDGLGGFTVLPLGAAITATAPTYEDRHRPLLRDTDGDGDLDFLLDGRVWWNGTRHVALTSPALLGGTATLTLRGPAAQPWLLGVSPGLVTVPVPSLGTLFLNPASTLLFLAGTMGTSGVSEVSIPVPPNVPLPLTFFWQAGVGSLPRLTNVTETPLLH